MSYGMYYIESDIRKLKTKGYKMKTIISIISKRIKYRYSDITKAGAKKIVLDAYNNKQTSSGWKSRRRGLKEVNVSNKELNRWKKLGLNSL